MKLKKILSLILILIFVLSSFFVVNINATENEEVYDYEGFSYGFEGDHIIIKGYLGDSVDLVIPSEINGIYVGTIAQEAFKDRIDIKSIVIPDSVYCVFDSAFENCTSLNSVTFGNGIEYIMTGAFRNCTLLKEIKIVSNNIWIYSYAFEGCSGLASVSVKGEGRSIESYAFKDCTEITDVRIIGSVSINENAFSNCKKINNVTLSEDASVGTNPFIGCPALYDISIEKNEDSTAVNNSKVTIIDGVAYSKDLSTMKDLANLSFCLVSKEGSFAIPDDVTRINPSAFNGCDKLTEITIPYGVTKLFNSFTNCSSLNTVTIPSSVYQIDSYAFVGSENITDVYYGGTKEQWDAIEYVDGDYCPELDGAVIHFSSDESYQEVYIKCPVDVYIYDSDANLVFEIVNEVINDIGNSGIKATINNFDEKSIFIPNNDIYQIETVARESGKLDIVVKDYDRNDACIGIECYVEIQMESAQLYDMKTVVDNVVTNDELLVPDKVSYNGEKIISVDAISDLLITKGNGEYLLGDTVELYVYEDISTAFDGWFAGDELVSYDKNYVFTAIENIVIEAKAHKHIYGNDNDESCDICGDIRVIRDDNTAKSVPMYRMYNPNSGEHFYTGSTEERDILVNAGWHYEGVAFNFPVVGKPVHRLYEPIAGEHLYTMDKEEMEKLLNAGWNYEGVAFNSAGGDEVAQYRLHNPNATCGAYHFTGSEEERDILINAGWEYQGIGFYSCLR